MMDPSPLAMEIRSINESERVVVGVVAPYDEITYLVADPNGERVRRGAFARSIQHRGAKIPLYRNHDHSTRLGVSRSFAEQDAGLVGEFVINAGDVGDRLLEDCRNGYFGGLSAAWIPLDAKRATDGVREISEAKLVECSLVGLAAYEGAGMLAVRQAAPILSPIPPRPDVCLDPIPPLVYRSR